MIDTTQTPKTWGEWQHDTYEPDRFVRFRGEQDEEADYLGLAYLNALEATIAAQDARIAGLVEAATMTYKLLAEHDIAELHPLAIVNCLDVMSHALAAAAETSEEET